MGEFIGDQIAVRCEAGGRPVSFTWGGAEYKIAEIEAMRRLIDHRKPWYRRRHRDNYVVRTESGEAFRLYFNRGPGRKYWVLQERLEPVN